MNNILVFTNDLEFGTTLSEKLLRANKKIIFIDNLDELIDNKDLFIIDLDDDEIKPKRIVKILEKHSAIRIIGVMNEIKKSSWEDYREAGCEIIYLRSSLIKNIDSILSKNN